VGGSRVLIERWVRWGSVSSSEDAMMFFIGFSDSGSDGVPVECPSGIAFGISLVGS